MSKLREEVKKVRKDYSSEELDQKGVPKNPLDLASKWLTEAIDAKVNEPNAFTLSTVSENRPDSRIVLLRDISDNGLVFYTNYKSQKAQDVAKNPNVSINFFWPEFSRQLRIHARIEKLSPEESNAYFATRPRESQLGAWASNQSEILTSREELKGKLAEFEKKFEGVEVPRPDFWGGYLMRPSYFEFWHGQMSRLHDRISYKLENDQWTINRLYP